MFYYPGKEILVSLTLRSRGPSSVFLWVFFPFPFACLAGAKNGRGGRGMEKREKEKERGPFPSLLNPLSLSPSFLAPHARS